jgi:hypothetical protein
LINSGVIKGNEEPRVLATFVQPATQYGVNSVIQWVDGFADTQETVDLTIAARQGQYAIDFETYYGENINLINTPPDGTNAQREVIDQAIVDIIDNPKVPVPQYTDVPAEFVNTTETVIQADGSLIKVPRTLTAAEEAAQVPGSFVSAVPIKTTPTPTTVVPPTVSTDDGTFRFAPGSNNRQG